jgi:lysyl-tRNA synthetase class 2
MEQSTNTLEGLSEEQVREIKLKNLQEQNKNPFKYNYKRTDIIQSLNDSYQHIEISEHVDGIVKVAGRLISKRNHGKAFFGNILDESGSIQLYANLNNIGDEAFEELISLDTGDILGVEGQIFKTQKGELTIKIASVELLSKSLLPLPEKYHGLQDIELRHRHRYLDLIANKDVRNNFKTRSKIIASIRQFLEEKGFMEVETPVLQNIYGGAAARPFNTFHNELKQNLYLRISLELPLKRLIVGGFEKVYEIGRVFRNEGISYKHNPEYTLLELYQAYADYYDIMELTENLLSTLVYKQYGSYKAIYQDKEIDFTPPFKRIKLCDILKEKLEIDINDIKALQKKAKELKLDVKDSSSKGHLIMELYDKVIEDTLIQPTFIMDHPWETSPLAKKHRDNPELVERFELIINGMEVANAFSELNDPIDQMHRFEDQRKAKEQGMEDAHPIDDDYVKALKHGMPPTGGLGIGIDRIVMLLTNIASIREVILFPHLKDKL